MQHTYTCVFNALVFLSLMTQIYCLVSDYGNNHVVPFAFLSDLYQQENHMTKTLVYLFLKWVLWLIYIDIIIQNLISSVTIDIIYITVMLWFSNNFLWYFMLTTAAPCSVWCPGWMNHLPPVWSSSFMCMVIIWGLACQFGNVGWIMLPMLFAFMVVDI